MQYVWQVSCASFPCLALPSPEPSAFSLLCVVVLQLTKERGSGNILYGFEEGTTTGAELDIECAQAAE